MKNLIVKTLSLKRGSKRNILVIIDLIIAYISHILGSITFIFYYSFYFNKIIISDLTVSNLLLAPLLIVIFFIFDIYKNLLRFIDFRFFLNLFKSFIIYYVIYLIVFSFFTSFINAFFLVTYQIFLTFFFIITSKILIKILIDNSLNDSLSRNSNIEKKDNVIIYGANDLGSKLYQILKNNNKYNIYCFLDDDFNLSNQLLANLKIFHISSSSKIIKAQNIKKVILANYDYKKIKKETIENFIKNKVQIKILEDYDILNEDVNYAKLKDLDFDTFLNRKEIKITDFDFDFQSFQTVLVTGAGGSIGAEITKQIVSLNPSKIILIDHSEISLFNITNHMLKKISNKRIILRSVLASAADNNLMRDIFSNNKIDAVFHCAAYKHVELVENNKFNGLINNVKSTIVCSELSSEFKVKKFVLISSDKAVNASTLMGVTKRLSEIYILSMQNKVNNNTCFCAVRFGNVLNSSGSVIPIFKEQILSGGPVTVRDENLTRYFMTISEAVALVIVASFISNPGKIYILNMGNPIKILDLAKQMINFYGYDYFINKNKDENIKIDFQKIEIIITKLNKTEKMHEELLVDKKNYQIIHEKIFQENQNKVYEYDLIHKLMKDLLMSAKRFNTKEMEDSISSIMKIS